MSSRTHGRLWACSAYIARQAIGLKVCLSDPPGYLAPSPTQHALRGHSRTRPPGAADSAFHAGFTLSTSLAGSSPQPPGKVTNPKCPCIISASSRLSSHAVLQHVGWRARSGTQTVLLLVTLQVMATVPDEVKPDAGVPHRPLQRQVHWRYFYAGGQRHVTEAIQGNRCAFCHILCLSFTVSACRWAAYEPDLPLSLQWAPHMQHACDRQG